MRKKRQQTNRQNRESGNAMLEFAMICMVLLISSLGAFDLAFSAYAFITVENAARIAGARNSSGWDSAADQSSACSMAVAQLQNLPGGNGYQGDCKSGSVVVTSVLCDASHPCSGQSPTPDGAVASAVSVSYSMPDLFKLPVVGPAVLTRTVEMRLRSSL